MATHETANPIFRALTQLKLKPELALEVSEYVRDQAGQNTIAILTGQIEAQGASFDALGTRIDAMGARIDALQAEMHGEIKAVNARIDALGDRIDMLSNTVNWVIWPLVISWLVVVAGGVFALLSGR